PPVKTLVPSLTTSVWLFFIIFLPLGLINTKWVSVLSGDARYANRHNAKLNKSWFKTILCA
ncbi:TPA: hypothetical protein ACS7XC_003867, partial [Providencia alcalifaciens]